MTDDGFAIVGMECIFPGAGNLAHYYRNLCDGVDAISDVPAGRWDPCFYDPDSTASDRLRCRRGGFIDRFARFDPLAYGIMPVAARAAEPDQLLALAVASAALRDAGYERKSLPRQRTGVVIGRGNYPGPGRIRLEQHVRVAEQLVHALRDLLPDVAPAELARVKREFQAQVGAASADAVIGLVPNLTASRLANRLDLNGPAYTVDAACASALIALERACQDLQCGTADVMLCGGVHTCHAEAFWSVFNELGAISASQCIRPFDQRADGLLLGEGVGIVVVKRAADAIAEGDRIYATVRGVGSSSDGKASSLMSPAVAGQLLALERAWRASGREPSELALLEAHGTATPTGDAAELQTLKAFFGAASGGTRAGLGSVKSMIGHAMPAAGAAGLIKAALAVYHGVQPRTLHCEQPHPLLADTRFELVAETRTWDAPRRIAAINAFGFGGINTHAILESAQRQRSSARSVRAEARQGAAPLLIAADSKEQLLLALAEGRGERSGRHRLAVIDPTPERIARARTLVERGQRLDGRQGFFYGFESPQQDPIAFLFPGLDSHFEPRAGDVAERFGMPEAGAPDDVSLEARGVAILELNALLLHALGALGIAPDATAGHSIGEWSALVASGVLEPKGLARFLATLRPGSLDFDNAVFAMAACGIARAEQLLDGIPELEISHDNCPHQVLFCGTPAAVARLLERATAASVIATQLPFGSGVHSSFFRSHLPQHIANVRGFAFGSPRIPVYSATSCEPFPHDPEAITTLTIEHMVRRVRFRELVERLHADGYRLFVQVGTGSLTSFVEDTLHGKPHAAISANVAQRSGLEQLLRVACLVWVRGGAPRFEVLFPELMSSHGQATPNGGVLQLALGVPLVRFEQPLAGFRAGVAGAEPPPHVAATSVAGAYASSVADLANGQAEVWSAYARRFAGVAPPTLPEQSGPLRTRVGLDTLPELADHAFFRQPAGWPDLADRGPVVPMTGLIELMLQAARERYPSRPIAAVEDIEALRWLAVPQPVDLTIDTVPDGDDRLVIRLGDYARGKVVFGEAGAAPARVFALANERPTPIDARTLYADGWMFHGPAYQGIARLGPMGRDGIRGELRAGPALGALLDNAGQLLGYFVMAQTDTDRLAMPIRLRRLRLFGPHPQPGTPVECLVQIRSLEPTRVVADLSLATASGIWAEVEGWEDRRFSTDAQLWNVIRQPDRQLLSACPAPGIAIFEPRYDGGPSRDYVLGRYLARAERETYAQLAPRDRRAFIGQRIAAKDAARAYLWGREFRPLFPIEVAVDDGERTARVRAEEGSQRLALATASTETFSVAVVGAAVAAVSVCPIAPAPSEVSTAELRLAGPDEPSEWLARLAVARAVAAQLGGATAAGAPVAISDRNGERLLTAHGFIETLRRGAQMIGWTTR